MINKNQSKQDCHFSEDEMEQILDFLNLEEKERAFQKANLEKAFKAWSEVSRTRLCGNNIS